jgi:hypothetical protein
MAEVGIAAAAAQFIDLGGRLVTALSRVIFDLRDAPERVNTLQVEVQQLLELVRITQSNITIAAKFNSSIDASILPDAIEKVQRLQQILDDLCAGPNSNLAIRTLSAIRTVKKEKEIDQLCKGLERQKTSLLIWFSNNNL